jgi:hypothetical protein
MQRLHLSHQNETLQNETNAIPCDEQLHSVKDS